MAINNVFCADILKKVGFTELPEELDDQKVNQEEALDWATHIDFERALKFYCLDLHKNFMSLFEPYLKKWMKDTDLKMATFMLNRFLFEPDKYGWDKRFKREIIDWLPAIVLLSGYLIHLDNMKKRSFDLSQIEKHRDRIKQSCILDMEVYHMNGIDLSHLMWGSIFINAHIVEIGRLQYEIKKYDYTFLPFKMDQEFCINLHIPRMGKLDSQSVEVSLEMAKKQLNRYFSELPHSFKVFLHSWLLSDHLEEYLPEMSNIRAFRHRFKILGYSGTSSLVKFLFNTCSDKISDYPEDSSLRYKVKRALLMGKKFHNGIGLLK